jgi:hypothetical protein
MLFKQKSFIAPQTKAEQRNEKEQSKSQQADENVNI